MTDTQLLSLASRRGSRRMPRRRAAAPENRETRPQAPPPEQMEARLQHWRDSLDRWIQGPGGGTRLKAHETLSSARLADLPGSWTADRLDKAAGPRSSWYRLVGNGLPLPKPGIEQALTDHEALDKKMPDRLRLLAAVRATQAHPAGRTQEAAYRRLLLETAKAQLAQRALSGKRAPAIQGTELVELHAWMHKRRRAGGTGVLCAEDALWAALLTVAQRRGDARKLRNRARDVRELVRLCYENRTALNGMTSTDLDHPGADGEHLAKGPAAPLAGDCGVVVAGLRQRRALLFAEPQEELQPPVLSNDTVDVVADALQDVANGLVIMWNSRDGIVGSTHVRAGDPPLNDGDILSAMHTLLTHAASAKALTLSGDDGAGD